MISLYAQYNKTIKSCFINTEEHFYALVSADGLNVTSVPQCTRNSSSLTLDINERLKVQSSVRQTMLNQTSTSIDV